MMVHPEEFDRPAARPDSEVRRGGFMKGQRPHATGETIVIVPVGRTRTPQGEKAFRKKVAKRRAKKGYR